MKPWSDLCKERGIFDTPLTPYLDEELLYNAGLSINGTAITGTGFEYTIPAPSVDNLREVVEGFIAKGIFPQGMI